MSRPVNPGLPPAIFDALCSGWERSSEGRARVRYSPETEAEITELDRVAAEKKAAWLASLKQT